MIKLEHINKTFEIGGKTVQAVKDVSLEIRQGEIFGIIGFSGAGKSTLVRCINLLEKPQSGRITIDNEDITNYSGLKLRQLRQKIGMIFQHFNLMPSRTVFENIELPLKLTALSSENRARKVNELLELVGLTDKAQNYPSQLSGGQKQRVAIAGVIAMRPDCLVLDESTAMLDPHGRSQVMKTIRQLREAGITIVSITHYMEEAAQADRVLVMSRGRIVMEGTPEQVFSQTERLHSYHLDVPQAAELRDELVKLGIPMPENVITPEACAEELFKLLK